MMKTWFNVSEAADYAGVSRDTIYTACERHELRSARLSGRRAIRIRPQWIDAWLEQHAAGRRAALEREHAVRSRVMSGVSDANGAIDSTRRTTRADGAPSRGAARTLCRDTSRLATSRQGTALPSPRSFGAIPAFGRGRVRPRERS